MLPWAPRFPEYFAVDAPGKRTNQEVTSCTVDRLEVAASGDIAWEFSHFTLEWHAEGHTPVHTKIDAAELRVWKKVTGEWQVAAAFARPLDTPFEPN